MDNNSHHSQLSQPSTPSQPDPDSTPQDVLAEARKNLQVLIDSGFPRELLHQWVDDSQSLHFLLPSASQPFAAMQPPPQRQPPSQPQHPLAPQQPQHLPPPPPPQGAPPTPPSQDPAGPVVSVSGPPPSTPTPTPLVPSIAIKAETVPDDVSRNWPSSNMASPNQTSDRTPANEPDTAALMAPPPPFSHSHHPRMSGSSVSSVSSGHGSIWSTNSAQSSFSWHSATAGNRAMAPLPMPPAASVPSLAAGAVAPSATSPGRHNIYWCTSCETSFKRKYDWKRHEDEFHERWRKYPCPEPGCNRSFWGSNSFNQHHKQCHGCRTCPHSEKVVRFLRKRKYWACGFCSALHPARERHVEHVARHVESGLSKCEWMHSRVIYGLLHQSLVRECWERLIGEKRPGYSGCRPQFSWHPSKTGRAQGFLENESAGQLQDLLEFFSGDSSDAEWIVTSAYELADIVLTPEGISSPRFAGAQTTTSMGPPQQYSSQDVHVTLSQVPTHSSRSSHQSIMPSPSPNSHDTFTSAFGNAMFAPAQPFSSTSGLSPESSSHSPLMASNSPLPSSHSPLETRDLPQLSTSTEQTSAESMDFDYSPAPVAFAGWDTLPGGAMHVPTQQSSNASHQGGWGVIPCFTDPQILS